MIEHEETVEERIQRLQKETGYSLKPIPDLTSKHDARKAREEAERTAPKVATGGWAHEGDRILYQSGLGE